MTDLLQLIWTASLWSLHLVLLISIAFLSRDKPVELKVATVLFLFYSLAALFSFEFDFFQYHVNYAPSAFSLIAYLITDLLFLIASAYLYGTRRKFSHAKPLEHCRFGNMALILLALTAQAINIAFNWEYLLLPKNEFIAEFSENLTPNLIYLTIPAESILIGAILFNPFKSRFLRWVVVIAAIATLLLSAFQGYRHLVLILVLVAAFRRYPKINGAGLIGITLTLTMAGELSNMIKMWFYSALLDPDFDQVAYVQWYFGNTEWMPISSEQAAAAANFSLGMKVMQIGGDFIQFARLFPFTSAWLENLQTTTDLIGKLVGIEYGQGTAYNLQLFIVNTLLVGGVFVFVVVFLIRTVANTVLTVYGLEIFFSLMRNSPSFWIGQIKMMVILLIFLVLTDSLGRRLPRVSVFRTQRLGRNSVERELSLDPIRLTSTAQK